MARIVPFRNSNGARRRSRRFRVSPFNALWLAILAAAWGLTQLPGADNRPLFSLPQIGSDPVATTSFALCSGFRRDNCVIDGDTFKFAGRSIRIADIDAPETHPSRCDYEERLGAEATRRLQELLNDGPFTLKGSLRDDEDQYGRQLREVMRDGRSLGAVLVSEGLAREWSGRRLPWCG